MLRLKKILRLILIVSILVAAGASTLRYVQDMQKDKLELITVWEQERSILHLPLYIALREGYFEEQNIRVQITGPGDVPSEPEPGRVPNPYTQPVSDVILADPVDALYHLAIKQSAPRIIASLAHKDDTYLVSSEKNQKEPFNWQNLKDKTVISYAPETGPGIALENMLREKGLRPHHDVSLYHRIPMDLQLGAFKAGSSPYVQLPGPEAMLVEKEKAGQIVARPGENALAFSSVLCIAWPAALEQKPVALQAFINGIYKAQLGLAQEPGIATGAVRDYLTPLSSRGRKIDPHITQALVTRYLDLGMWNPDPVLEKTPLENYNQSLIVAGQQPSLVNFQEVADNSFALAAMQSVKYIPKQEKKLWQKIFRR